MSEEIADMQRNGQPDEGVVVSDEAGHMIGTCCGNEHGWFANPNGSQIQSIPCESRADAVATVRRLADPNARPRLITDLYT